MDVRVSIAHQPLPSRILSFADALAKRPRLLLRKGHPVFLGSASPDHVSLLGAWMEGIGWLLISPIALQLLNNSAVPNDLMVIQVDDEPLQVRDARISLR